MVPAYSDARTRTKADTVEWITERYRSKYVNAHRMNRASSSTLCDQATLAWPVSRTGRQKRRRMGGWRRGGLIDINQETVQPCPAKTPSVCSYFSAADSQIYIWCVAAYICSIWGCRFMLQTSASRGGQVIKSLRHLISDFLCFCLLPAPYPIMHRNCRYISATRG